MGTFFFCSSTKIVLEREREAWGRRGVALSTPGRKEWKNKTWHPGCSWLKASFSCALKPASSLPACPESGGYRKINSVCIWALIYQLPTAIKVSPIWWLQHISLLSPLGFKWTLVKTSCPSVRVGGKGKAHHFCSPFVDPHASESSQSSVTAAFGVVWILLLGCVLSPVQLRVSCLSLGYIPVVRTSSALSISGKKSVIKDAKSFQVFRLYF